MKVISRIGPALSLAIVGACVPIKTGRIAQSPSPNAADSFLQEQRADSLRVMTHNVNWDSIFPADDPQNHDLRGFDRQAAALVGLPAAE